jgi:hypothetical protein
MGHSLTIEYAHEVCKKVGAVPGVFVETGTFFGDTADAMTHIFESVHTIELSELYYLLALNRFVGRDRVRPHWGNSSDILPILCRNIDEPIFFYLDAHFAGHDTARSCVEVPLMAELSAIAQREHSDIVVIDDARLFGEKRDEGGFTVDWRGITEENILACFPDEKRLLHYYDYDRLIILTGNTNAGKDTTAVS